MLKKENPADKSRRKNAVRNGFGVVNKPIILYKPTTIAGWSAGRIWSKYSQGKFVSTLKFSLNAANSNN